MRRPASFITTAFGHFMALLLVLWPVLCCCGLGCGGEKLRVSVALSGHQQAAGLRDAVGQQAGFEVAGNEEGHHQGGPSCCEKRDGQSKSKDKDPGCNCEKSKSSLAKGEASSQAIGPLLSSYSWVSAVATLTPNLARPARSFGIDAERPPTPSLYALRVLRI